MNWWFKKANKKEKRQGSLVFDWFYMKFNAIGEKRMLPWQTMRIFIFSFISSQILSKAHKYWGCWKLC